MILGIVDLLRRKGTVYQHFQSVDHENEDTLKVTIISYPLYNWERNLHCFFEVNHKAEVKEYKVVSCFQYPSVYKDLLG